MYVKSAHINVSFGDVMYFGLRGEGRRNCKVWSHWNSLNLVLFVIYYTFITFILTTILFSYINVNSTYYKTFKITFIQFPFYIMLPVLGYLTDPQEAEKWQKIWYKNLFARWLRMLVSFLNVIYIYNITYFRKKI